MQDAALIAAGAIGALVAIVHSIIVRRRITAPLASALSDRAGFPPSAARLTPILLDFSGFNWFLGGILLMSAPFWLGDEATFVAALVVGSSYLYAIIGNFWGTRGRHPGWALYAVALALLVYAVWQPGA